MHFQFDCETKVEIIETFEENRALVSTRLINFLPYCHRCCHRQPALMTLIWFCIRPASPNISFQEYGSRTVGEIMGINLFSLHPSVAWFWVSYLASDITKVIDCIISTSWIPFRVARNSRAISTSDIIVTGVSVSVALLCSSFIRCGHDAVESGYLPM